ncbi:MAG: hypothetical protein GY950_14670 [bacterium]|nr:hypothetical protein [bacterium]
MAEYESNELEIAGKYALESYETLKKKKNLSLSVQAWMLLTRAMILHVDEGNKKNRAETIERFKEAVDLYYQAIKLEPDNGTLFNNIGWVFLKLTRWEVETVKPGGHKGIPCMELENTALMAECCLRYSLTTNTRNKLSHANLCSLYATPGFRANREKYLDRCRYHGLRAVEIDPGYINGYRTLAVSLIRYKEFNEAFKYFENALRLAAEVEKDQEIIKDALEALDEIKAPKKEKKKWQTPKPELLIPPEKKAQDPH